jgi:hypothetical protein
MKEHRHRQDPSSVGFTCTGKVIWHKPPERSQSYAVVRCVCYGAVVTSHRCPDHDLYSTPIFTMHGDSTGVGYLLVQQIPKRFSVGKIFWAVLHTSLPTVFERISLTSNRHLQVPHPTLAHQHQHP